MCVCVCEWCVACVCVCVRACLFVNVLVSIPRIEAVCLNAGDGMQHRDTGVPRKTQSGVSRACTYIAKLATF